MNMDVLKNFLFPKIDFKRDIIRAKIWFLYGKRLLANNMTGHADVRLCKLGGGWRLVKGMYHALFFSLSSQRSKKPKKNNNAWSQVIWDLKKIHLSFLFCFVFVVQFIGLFNAAHDVNIEWVIVKGISHFSNDGNAPSESWKSFASIMAASLVSNMLSDPVVFKEWPHYEGMCYLLFLFVC